MREAASWRNWDGRPEQPGRSGWHWVEDGDGVRPMLWRGEDWPVSSDRGEWQDGHAMLGPRDLRHGRYHGPLVMPAGVGELFRSDMLIGVV